MSDRKDDRVYMDNFHAHLDECERCRNSPLDLCPLGNALFLQAGEAAVRAVGKDIAK